MPDNKLTDNEIIKALKEMVDYPNYYEEGQQLKNVLDLINRLQAEKDDLERIVGLMNKRKYYRKFVDEVYRKEEGKELCDPDFDYIYELYFKLQAENIALNRRAILSSGHILKVGNALLFAEKEEDYNITINTIKAESYKECIEKIKDKSCKLNMCHNDIVVKTDYQISGESLNNILKELVGEDNDT